VRVNDKFYDCALSILLAGPESPFPLGIKVDGDRAMDFDSVNLFSADVGMPDELAEVEDLQLRLASLSPTVVILVGTTSVDR
jgi:hypothetical protein